MGPGRRRVAPARLAVTADSASLILTESVDAVRVLTLNRPDRHNSLVPELLLPLLDSLSDVARNLEVRAVVLQAAGPSFSTGGDVRRFWEETDRLSDYAAEVVGLLNEVIVTMMQISQPIVAAVHGLVTGGSLGLVLGSDVVLVAPEASFTPWYGPVGFAPDGGWTALMPAVIGPARASEALLTNRTIAADQAVEWGLATRVVAAPEIRFEALDTARRIAGHVRGAVGHIKARMRSDLTTIAQGLEDERQRFIRQVVTDEAREGMARFLGIGRPDSAW